MVETARARGHPPGPTAPTRAERVESARRFAAQVAVLPQLVLLQLALVFALATMVGEPGRVRAWRLLGAALAAAVLLLGGLAWRRQHVAVRVLEVPIGLVAVWVSLAGLDAALL